jgi:hypothetical protein
VLSDNFSDMRPKFEARGVCRVMQNSSFRKSLKKHELIVNFEVIFDRCQVRYITGKVYNI